MGKTLKGCLEECRKIRDAAKGEVNKYVVKKHRSKALQVIEAEYLKCVTACLSCFFAEQKPCKNDTERTTVAEVQETSSQEVPAIQPPPRTWHHPQQVIRGGDRRVIHWHGTVEGCYKIHFHGLGCLGDSTAEDSQLVIIVEGEEVEKLRASNTSACYCGKEIVVLFQGPSSSSALFSFWKCKIGE